MSNDFQPGDVFISVTDDNGTVVLQRAVRQSRLRRETKKYLRRIMQTGATFVVLRNNRPVAEIGPNTDNQKTVKGN